MQSITYCMADKALLTSMIHLDDTQNSVSKISESIIIEDDGGKQQKWILTMQNLLREYKINTYTSEEQKPDVAEFSITVNNNVVISAIKFESKIMHLILMLRIFNSKIHHKNVYFIDNPRKTMQEVTFTIQDIKMMLTEKETPDINAIFHGLLTTVTSIFRRIYETNDFQNAIRLTVESMKLNYVIGSSFVIRTEDRKEEEDKEGNSLASSSDERQRTKQTQQMAQFNFDIEILNGEMNAKISSIVAAKYNFKNTRCFGIFPKKGKASIENHSITYTSFYSKKVPKWMRLGSFSIKLPSLLVVYEKCTVNENEIIRMGNKEIVCSNESYANIVITVGSLDQSINTDILNMLLYSHETAIAEVQHVMEILCANSSNKSPFLFQLQICCKNVSPWLKLTLTDTTNTAFRITTEVINIFFMGRNILNNNIFERQIQGNISFCLNFKLGQMIRNEAFQEDELRELADLTTNAKDILRDFTLSRSFWMKQKMFHAMQARNDSSQITSHSSLLDATYGVSMKITLLFRDRTTACIPLYSNNYRPFTSALLFGLKDAEAIIKFVRRAKIEAKFSDFKFIFVENFEYSMEESWINGQEVTSTNFAFFPLGLCKIIVKSSRSEQYKQVASVQCSMKGLLFDIDSRIGSLIGAVRNTCAAVNADQDVDASEYEPMKIVISELERDDDINPKNEYASIVKPEERIRWVEQKIYEQTQRLAAIKTHRTDVAYQWELRRLKKLQLIRVKQFKESMLDRLKRQKLRVKQFKKSPPITEDKTKDESDGEEKSDNESVTGEQSVKFFRETATNYRSKGNIGSALLGEDEILAKMNDHMMRTDEKINNKFAFDMQFFGEAGECMLRNRIPTELTSMTSAVPDDIKRHDEKSAGCTKISLPRKKSTAAITSKNTCIPYLYISANVANMPEETALTPVVADFFQQLLENFPQHIPQQSENESETFTVTNTEPLLMYIHSKLMISILLSITIQSSSLRFEAHQQRAGAMDLLLRLPSLKLVASAQNDGINNGLDISLTLQSLSVCFYNPRQPSPLDAFALTLDKFIVGISRTSVFLNDNSHFKITCAIDIGQATFTYDMRKLSQLIAFPAPWYRRRIAQRLLFKHGQFLRSQGVGAGRSFSRRTSKLMNKLSIEASVSVHWEAFKAKIQMSSAMGDTNWIVDKISAKTIFCLKPLVERRLNVCFAASFLEQEAKGGAISGSLRLSNTAFDFSWISLCNKPTLFSSKINFTKLEIRIVWMGRVIIIVLFDQPSLLLHDEWKLYNDQDGKIKEAVIMLNTILKYSKLQAIITKATINSIDSIIQKLSVFFKEQMQDSRVLLNLTNSTASSAINSEEKLSKIFHWATVLDLVTDMQMKSKTFPIPNASNGRTIISGRFISIGQQASLVLMEGEITANRWALFYLNQPTLIFSNAAQYVFLDDKQTIGIDLSEKLMLKLSGVVKENKPHDGNWTSVICKVERRKDQIWPKHATVQECLALCIDEPLGQLFSLSHHSNESQPTVLELFELPAMDAIFTSNQKIPIHSEKLRDIKSEVLCSFICDFHHPLGVQTDLTTQINFLPELLRSYLIEQDKEIEKGIRKSSMEKIRKTDQRQYICKKWKVDPKIRFIDKVKWDPPVIDEILRKLQIFDHRNTIPKVVQRHILDHCDMFASKALLCVVETAKETSVKSDPTSNNL
ncbi:Fragile site-associated protein C-terminus family protein [Acanthocheilonema viteae]